MIISRNLILFLSIFSIFSCRTLDGRDASSEVQKKNVTEIDKFCLNHIGDAGWTDGDVYVYDNKGDMHDLRSTGTENEQYTKCREWLADCKCGDESEVVGCYIGLGRSITAKRDYFCKKHS